MSREVDLSTKLSEADREYLLARGREQQVFANDAQFSDDPEALARALYVPGTAIDKAEGVPDTPDEPLDADDGDDEAEDYSGEEWTKAKLVEEIERRNAEYGEEFQMPISGTKKELAAILVEDDNTSDEEDE